MQVAILDHHFSDQEILVNKIFEHCLCPIKKNNVFISQYNDNKKFIESLYHGDDYQIVYLEVSSIDSNTFEAMKELLPYCTIILITANEDYIPFNNFEVLLKPYDSQRIIDTLVFFSFL
ncbi:hypothetical protein [Tannockella kyphosi]|uniref:hypothetical protein n=1 Tax=Tannockella kyphosi TaxID=2899121 RepID=UPI002012E16B|nr:hypothetical protein [Tannockella kyphosi]